MAPPVHELIGQALREPVPTYSEPAIRELVAIASIHQDLSVTGSGSTMALFSGAARIPGPRTHRS